MTDEDWERAGGLNCPECRREVVRLIRGLCPSCRAVADAAESERLAEKSARRYYRSQLNKGMISLSQMREGR